MLSRKVNFQRVRFSSRSTSGSVERVTSVMPRCSAQYLVQNGFLITVQSARSDYKMEFLQGFGDFVEEMMKMMDKARPEVGFVDPPGNFIGGPEVHNL